MKRAVNGLKSAGILSVGELADQGLIDDASSSSSTSRAKRSRRLMATAYFDRRCVDICEDRGAGRTHHVTPHLIESTRLKTFVFDASKCRFVKVTAPSNLDGIKQHASVGYNAFATSSPIWEDRLLSATWSYR